MTHGKLIRQKYTKYAQSSVTFASPPLFAGFDLKIHTPFFFKKKLAVHLEIKAIHNLTPYP